MSVIDKTYHHLLQTILDDGFTYEDPNRKGINRIQIPSYTFKHDFKDGFPAITTKKLYWKGIVGELLWFLRGNTNIKYLVDNGINIWNKDALNYSNSGKLGKGPIQTEEEFLKDVCNGTQMPGELGRVYGAQWRKWKGEVNPTFINKKGFGVVNTVFDELHTTYIDQISNLIKGLKENPMGTKHIVTAWNPAELNDMALPPCHWSFEILVEPLTLKNRLNYFRKNNSKNGTIDYDNRHHQFLDFHNIPLYQFTLKWHQRSCDSYLGIPFNIASYALLAHIIGKMTNMIPKGIIGDLSNVHIYEPHLDAVKEQLSREVDKYNGNVFVNVKHMHEPNNIDKYINRLKISDFTLEDYKSYPAIPAEMLPYSS
jgi:thymidylate synthase